MKKTKKSTKDSNSEEEKSQIVISSRLGSSGNKMKPSEVSVEEDILREINDLYSKSNFGLLKFAEELGFSKEIFSPRKKINILICGNHSSGKSSFINYYVGEYIQKTGVAIETQGITLVHNGKRRDTLEGPATVNLHPYLKDISKWKGVLENLSTEVCVSNEKKFPLVTLIDTPGLVDGNTSYPFDVEEVLKFLAKNSDLIYVFFDPIGQALCKRTMNVVRILNESFPEKMRYFLSKADDVDNIQDLQKILVQLTQNLSMVVRDKGFELRTMYITDDHSKGIHNSLDEACKEIEKCINLSIQRALNQLEIDCSKISDRVDQLLKEEEKAKLANRNARYQAFRFASIAFLLPVLVALSAMHPLLNMYFSDASNEDSISVLMGRTLLMLSASASFLTEGRMINFLASSIVIFFLFILIAKVTWKYRPVRSYREISRLKEYQKYVNDTVKPKQKELYNKYLEQIVQD